MMVAIPKGGSSIINPEVDWNQVRETILMLGIVVAQVRHAMADSSASLNTLANSFAETSAHIEAIKSALLEVGQSLPAELNIEARVAEINEQNLKSVVAFQFFDRLSQRLDHVCGAVSALAELVSDRQICFLPDEWMGLQNRIRSQYTTEQEKVLFDAILKGLPISEAIALAGSMDTTALASSNSEIELF